MSSQRAVVGWLVCLLVGCSSTPSSRSGGSGSTGTGTNDGGADAQLPSRHDGGGNTREDGGPPTSLPPCEHAASDDGDQDGFTGAQGDCYDCDARINPGAFDFPDNGIDDDCRGGDATPEDYACDEGLAIDSVDAKDAARAIGLCTFAEASSDGWGVLSARYTVPDGSRALSESAQIGILPDFGAEGPRAGASMLALSSGIARAPGQPGSPAPEERCGAYYTSGSYTEWPDGYPRSSPACGAGTKATSALFDPATLELQIRVPTNARSLSFDSDFYTYEYPDYICTGYNDYFLVLLDPPPAEHPDGNVVFDAEGNWISVNNGLLQVCTPGTHQGKAFTCPLGTSRLEDTGYDADDSLCGEGAATGWLHTVVPVTPGSTIRLRFAIWDTKDPNRDSTALIDNLQWDVDAPEAIVTEPVVVL